MKHKGSKILLMGMCLTGAASSAMSTVSADREFSFKPVDEAEAPIRLAIWSAGQDSGGWYIRNGRDAGSKIYMKSKKKAEKTAKKFNKMEKDGFKAEETGPCADPTSGVRC